MGKKRAIVDIAKQLAKMGYEVKYNVQRVPGGTGTFNLYLIKDDGTKILLFTNSWKETDSNAITAYSPIGKENDIIDKILPQIAELPSK